MLSVLLSVIGHRRLRVYIINARDGISEVVVGSERVPDQCLHEDADDIVPFCSLQGRTEQQMQCRRSKATRWIAVSACVTAFHCSALSAKADPSGAQAPFPNWQTRTLR